MNIIIFLAGMLVGVLATLAFNYFFPKAVDAATAKAAKEVKERL